VNVHEQARALLARAEQTAEERVEQFSTYTLPPVAFHHLYTINHGILGLEWQYREPVVNGCDDLAIAGDPRAIQPRVGRNRRFLRGIALEPYPIKGAFLVKIPQLERLLDHELVRNLRSSVERVPRDLVIVSKWYGARAEEPGVVLAFIFPDVLEQVVRRGIQAVQEGLETKLVTVDDVPRVRLQRPERESPSANLLGIRMFPKHEFIQRKTEHRVRERRAALDRVTEQVIEPMLVLRQPDRRRVDPVERHGQLLPNTIGHNCLYHRSLAL